MTTTTRSCSTCGCELADWANFCPRCGVASPTALTPSVSPPINAAAAAAARLAEEAEARHRKRLQHALGPSIELRGLLGRGGFAEVYVGWDAKLKRELAIKTLRADLPSSESLLRRFQHEAEAIAKLRHPHIVPIYSVGEGDGIAFFTMPRIEGESLAHALDRDWRLPLGDACRILREAAGALAAAHRAGIVHRDIKPENIMLEGPDRRALVMDFGIAKTLGAADAGFTNTGMLVGTPTYMSPEHAAGDRDVDARSDQYSLAAVGYRMMTGRPLFEGPTVQSVLLKQIADAPRPAHEIAPDVPRALSDALARALSKNPEDRFPSMEAFSDALEVPLVPIGTNEWAVPSRRDVDPLTRAARVRRRVLRSWKPLAATGIASLFIAALLFPRVISPTALAIAADRAGAEVVARQAVMAHGVDSPLSTDPEIASDDSAAALLTANVSPAFAEGAAGHLVPIWYWRVWVTERGGSRVWRVNVGAGERVIGYAEMLNDTARAATISADSAQTLARAELALHGVDPDTMIALADSVVRRTAREDRILRWDAKGAIPWHTDSVPRRFAVQIAGDRVAGYEQRLVYPRYFAEWMEGGRWSQIASAIGWSLAVTLLVIALVLAIIRQARDTLQWWLGARVLLVVGLLVAAPVLKNQFADTLHSSDPFGADFASTFFVILFVLLVIGGGLFVITVVGESLAEEVRPGSLAEVRDVARLSWRPPELALGALGGIAGGLGMLALQAIALWVAHRVRVPIGVGLDTAFAYDVTFAAFLESLGAGIAAACAVLFLLALGRKARMPGWLATALAALLVSGMNGGGATPLADCIRAALLAVVLAIVVWEAGLLGGAIAAFTYGAGTRIVVLLMSGETSYVVAALAGIALIVACGMAGWLAWRAIPLQPLSLTPTVGIRARTSARSSTSP